MERPRDPVGLASMLDACLEKHVFGIGGREGGAVRDSRAHIFEIGMTITGHSDD